MIVLLYLLFDKIVRFISIDLLRLRPEIYAEKAHHSLCVCCFVFPLTYTQFLFAFSSTASSVVTAAAVVCMCVRVYVCLSAHACVCSFV